MKKITCTTLILEALIRADDFRTAKQLQETTNCNCNQTSAALIHLRKRKAVNAMDADGNLWWYATPQDDDRSYKVEEREPEKRPRKRRSRRSAKALGE